MAAQKQILESIRDIIGGETDEEILDLTEMVTPPANVNAKPIDLFKEELTVEPITNDVLSEIDALLANDDKKPAAPPISTSDAEIELADFSAPEARKPEVKPTTAPITKETGMEKEEPILSKESAEEARDSLKALMNIAETVNRPKVQNAPFRNGDTVEDLVMDMLKPILKDWLDANLPGLVQNIVEKEIKKLIPKE